MRLNSRAALRPLLSVALVAVLAGSVGCSWFRGANPYDLPASERPLEVPPDLDAPRDQAVLRVPAASTAMASTAAPGAAVAAESFEVADSAEGTFRRLGIALSRIEGVEIVERSQLLGLYTVRFDGAEFLLKTEAQGESSRVRAVGKDGAALGGGAPGRLVGQLAQRLN